MSAKVVRLIHCRFRPLGKLGVTCLVATLLASACESPEAVAQAPKRNPTGGVVAPGKSAPTKGVSGPSVGVRPAGATTAIPPGGAANVGGQVNPLQPNPTDIAASVNGQAITRDTLARECLRRYGKDVLENVVNRQLIWQACQKQKINITDQDVETEVDNIARKFGLDKNRWIQLLQDERDVAPDQYRREIVWPTLALRRLAAQDIQVSNEEVKKAFEAEFGPSIKVRMIALDTKKEADSIRAKAVAKPDSFGDLAKEHSKDPNSASARGMIPPIRRHVGDAKIEDVVFQMKKGDISPVIQVADQFLIFKCEDHLPEKYVDSKKITQVQEQMKDRIRDDKLRDAAANMFKNLQQDAQVVNVMNDPALQAQHPGVAALINGRPIMLASLADDCVARHGKSVLDGEINRLILNQELQRKNLGVAQEDIDQEIKRAAESYGYVTKDGAPDIDAWIKAVTDQDKVPVDLYVRDAVWPSVALKKLVMDQVEVTDDDLRKGFEANYGERVEIMAIVLTNQRQAQNVWQMARDNPTDQFFGELAQQYSVESMSRSNSGRVPPIRRHGGQPKLEEEAFKLKAGELSGLIALADKYIILRCLGRTKPTVQDFNVVKDELSKDIAEKKLRIEMAKAFDVLKENARIDNRLAGTISLGAKANPVQKAAALVPPSQPVNARNGQPAAGNAPKPAGNRLQPATKPNAIRR